MTILPVLAATNLTDAMLRFPLFLVELRWTREPNRLVADVADLKDLELELLVFALRFLLFELRAIFITTSMCSLAYSHTAKQLNLFDRCTQLLQQFFHVFSRTAQHGAIATLYDWTLDQIRMLDHQID